MWFRILVLALGTFAIGTDGFVIAGILPAIAQDLNVPIATAGLSVTVFSITYALAAPVLAALTGNMARRHLLLLSLCSFTLANILTVVSTNFTMFLIARVLAACGAALYTPTASSVAAALAAPEQRGRALSIVMAGLTLATVIGVPLGVLISAQANWQMTLVLVIVLGIIAFLGVLTLFPAVANPPTVSLRQGLTLLKNPVIVLVLVTTLCWIMGIQVLATYFSTLLGQVTHLDGTAISGIFLLFGIAGFLGNSLSGYGADRWGSVRTITIALTGVTIALLTLPLVASNPTGVAIVIFLLGITGWMVIPPQQHRLISLVPGLVGVVLSLNSSAIYLGMGAGSALGGFVLSYVPVTTLSWVGSVFEIIALGVLFWSVWLIKRGSTHSVQPEVENQNDTSIGVSARL